MTHEERIVWNILRHHRGKDNAILNRDLEAQSGLPDRIMRQAKEGLRSHYPIAFCATGSYVIETVEECEEAIRSTGSYQLAFARKKRLLEQGLQRKQTETVEQTELFPAPSTAEVLT